MVIPPSSSSTEIKKKEKELRWTSTLRTISTANLVNWGGQACRLGGLAPPPPGPSLAWPLLQLKHAMLNHTDLRLSFSVYYVFKITSTRWRPLEVIHCCRRFLMFSITRLAISCGISSTVGRMAAFSLSIVVGRVGLNLNFESAHELLINLNFVFSNSMNLNFVFSKSMNLNFVFSKSMNLNLNFVFSTSINLNFLIKHSTNFEFFDLNLTKQMQQFVTGSYRLMLQTFHTILSSQQKVYDGKYDAARRFEVVFDHSNLLNAPAGEWTLHKRSDIYIYTRLHLR